MILIRIFQEKLLQSTEVATLPMPIIITAFNQWGRWRPFVITAFVLPVAEEIPGWQDIVPLLLTPTCWMPSYDQQVPGDPISSLKNGILEIKNNSTIMNARNAVSLGAWHIPWPNTEYYGGLVIASNSSFIGNKRAVEFMQYSREDHSSFTNVTFEGGDLSTSHWANRGVEYNNCTFDAYKNDAIYALDAAIEVINGCDFYNVDHYLSTNNSGECSFFCVKTIFDKRSALKIKRCVAASLRENTLA